MIVTINVMDNKYKWNTKKLLAMNRNVAKTISDERSALLNKKLNNGEIKDYSITIK